MNKSTSLEHDVKTVDLICTNHTMFIITNYTFFKHY